MTPNPSSTRLGDSVPDLSDHTATIRAQIETDVRKLLALLGSQRPERVALGCLVNAHRGRDVFKTGETVCGLPFTVDRSNIRSITVWYTDYSWHSSFKTTTW